MRATLVVDETGDFSNPHQIVAVAGVLFADRSPWCRSVFLQPLYAKALPAVPLPLHLHSGLNWVHLAVRSSVLGDGANRRVRPRPTMLDPRAEKGLHTAQDGGGVATEHAAALASEVVWRIESTDKNEILAELGGLIGGAMGQPLAPEAKYHAAVLRRTWTAGAHDALARVEAAVSREAEPTYEDLNRLGRVAMKPGVGENARLWFEAAAAQMRSGLTRANRVVFGAEADSRAVWVAAAEPGPGFVARDVQASRRWLDLFAVLVERSLAVAAERRFSSIAVTVLVPNHLPSYARESGQSLRDLIKGELGVVVSRNAFLGVTAKLAHLENNHGVLKRAKLGLADIAAFAAGRALRSGKNWDAIRANLSEQGISSVESPGIEPIHRPHLASSGPPLQWLATDPPRPDKPDRTGCAPWAWEQADAWAGGQP